MSLVMDIRENRRHLWPEFLVAIFHFKMLVSCLLRVDKVYLVMVNFYEKSLKRDEVYEGSYSVEFSELL